MNTAVLPLVSCHKGAVARTGYNRRSCIVEKPKYICSIFAPLLALSHRLVNAVHTSARLDWFHSTILDFGESEGSGRGKGKDYYGLWEEDAFKYQTLPYSTNHSWLPFDLHPIHQPVAWNKSRHGNKTPPLHPLKYWVYDGHGVLSSTRTSNIRLLASAF